MLSALPSFFRSPTVLVAPATAVLTAGCHTADTGTIAVAGLSLAALGAGAWTAYRRITASRAAAAAPETSAPAAKIVHPGDVIQTLIAKRYPILKERTYHSLSKTIVDRVINAMGPELNLKVADALVEAQVRNLILDLRKFTHTPITQRLWMAIDPHDGLFEALSHSNPDIVLKAVRRIMKIAYYQEPLPLPAIILVPLRRLILSAETPQELALDGLLALESIAAPAKRPYTGERQFSETALSILVYDGLAHKNRDVAEKARQTLQRILMRRPEIFSDEMREAMKP